MQAYLSVLGLAFMAGLMLPIGAAVITMIHMTAIPAITAAIMGRPSDLGGVTAGAVGVAAAPTAVAASVVVFIAAASMVVAFMAEEASMGAGTINRDGGWCRS